MQIRHCCTLAPDKSAASWGQKGRLLDVQMPSFLLLVGFKFEFCSRIIQLTFADPIPAAAFSPALPRLLVNTPVASFDPELFENLD